MQSANDLTVHSKNYRNNKTDRSKKRRQPASFSLVVATIVVMFFTGTASVSTEAKSIVHSVLKGANLIKKASDCVQEKLNNNDKLICQNAIADEVTGEAKNLAKQRLLGAAGKVAGKIGGKIVISAAVVTKWIPVISQVTSAAQTGWMVGSVVSDTFVQPKLKQLFLDKRKEEAAAFEAETRRLVAAAIKEREMQEMERRLRQKAESFMEEQDQEIITKANSYRQGFALYEQQRRESGLEERREASDRLQTTMIAAKQQAPISDVWSTGGRRKRKAFRVRGESRTRDDDQLQSYDNTTQNSLPQIDVGDCSLLRKTDVTDASNALKKVDRDYTIKASNAYNAGNHHELSEIVNSFQKSFWEGAGNLFDAILAGFYQCKHGKSLPWLALNPEERREHAMRLCPEASRKLSQASAADIQETRTGPLTILKDLSDLISLNMKLNICVVEKMTI